MHYELADYQWTAIRPTPPNEARGVPRVNYRRVLLGPPIRSTWRDLPAEFGPYATCYNRFVRWRQARVCGRIIDALAAAYGAAVQMIDTSVVRVDQHGSCITRNQRQSMGRSRGGLTSKIHAVVDSNSLPVGLAEPRSRRKATAAIRPASAPIFTALATGSSGSSARSNNVVGWRRAMTGLLQLSCLRSTRVNQAMAGP
jgi:transposase